MIREPAIYREGVCYRRVDELQVGDRVDLQGDMFGDPDHEEDGHDCQFEFEYEAVMSIEVEKTPVVDCYVVTFVSGFTCGFPVYHEVEVDGEQEEREG